MQKNINEDNSASNTVNATITSDSTTLSTNKGNTLFVATGADFVSLSERTNEATITMNKANTFSNRGLTYLKTSESFKVTALGDFFLL